MTSIVVHCSQCGVRIRACAETTAGKRVRCPKCRQRFVVPPLAGLSQRPSEPSGPLECQDSFSLTAARLKEIETQLRKPIVYWKIAAGIILLVFTSGLMWLVQFFNLALLITIYHESQPPIVVWGSVIRPSYNLDTRLNWTLAFVLALGAVWLAYPVSRRGWVIKLLYMIGLSGIVPGFAAIKGWEGIREGLGKD